MTPPNARIARSQAKAAEIHIDSEDEKSDISESEYSEDGKSSVASSSSDESSENDGYELYSTTAIRLISNNKKVREP